MAVALILKLPLPVGFTGLMLFTVSHVWLLVTLHARLAVTLTVTLAASADGICQLLPESVSDAGAAGWDTVIVRVTPGTVTVRVPIRVAVPVLAVALSTKEPLPVRFRGVILETSSHVTLDENPHCQLDVTYIVAVLALCVFKSHVLIDRFNVGVGAGWDTANVRVVAPAMLTVMVPVLVAVVVLAVAFNRKDPLPVRFAGVMFDIVSHDWLLDAVHGRFDVTFTVALLAP